MGSVRVHAVDNGTPADGTPAVLARMWSLRREWARAFAVMLVLLLVAAVATIVGVRGVVDQIRSTATELHVQSDMVAELRSHLVQHEQVGHQLLWDKPADRAAFIVEQQSISRLFRETAAVFPDEYGMRATILEASDSWREGLAAYGLWGDDMPEVLKQEDNPAFGASSDETRALLDSLAETSLAAMDRGLAHGDNLERILLVSLVGLFALALAVTMYFRRRMARDLMLPVATLHEGVLRLQAGDYDHRIDIARRDELGELAEAFNGMAGALHENHLALTRRATLDTLTGLANRASLTESLTASFGSGDRRHQQESLLFIDIDDFKEVNDSMGHEGGDALLVQMAGRLNRCVRAGDLVARLGGDEFAILAPDDNDGSAASGIAERILEVLCEPFTVGGDSLIVTVSIGVARRDSRTVDEAALLRHADFAMYMAKGAGKARHEFFDSVMYDHMVERST